MEKFEGKKLLVLGSNVSATDIVAYAKEHGAYTIVADYYSEERSAAKRIADRQVMISTADLDALSDLIEKEKVDGVLAGISEFNLLQAMALSEKHNLPFYCTKEQWDAVEKKDIFRNLCNQYEVPCPKTYFTGKTIPDDVHDRVEYPVVVKPVDGSSSKGVSICYSREDFMTCLNIAQNASGCGEVILEEFADGDEFTAHYAIAEGVVSLSCVDNRYPVAVHEGKVTTIPVARLYPCLFLDEYIRQVNPSMLQLCKGLGLRNAIVFIQGIYDKNKNRFYIFEAGLRSAGEAPYRFIERINGVNAIHVLVDQALSVPSDFETKKEDPFMKGKCCGIVSFVARSATVGQIIGLEDAVKATPSVIAYESRYPVGSTTPDTDTLRQLMIRFVMICENREQMAKDIQYLNEHVTVLDTEGNNMVIKMEPDRVFDIK